MAEYKIEGPEIKKLVQLTKKGPLAFAYNPGKDDDDYFAMHRKRDAKKMAPIVKKEGPGSKVAYGTAELKGGVFWLSCEQLVPGLAKKLKKYLKANKVSVTVKVLGPDGVEVVEPGDEVEDDLPEDVTDAELAEDDTAEAEDLKDADADEEEAAEDEKAPALDAKEIVARIKAAQPGVVAAPASVAGKLGAALKQAAGAVKSGDLETAESTITKIEAALAKIAAAGAGAAKAPPAEAEDAKPAEDTGGKRAAIVARIKALQAQIAGLPEGPRTKLQAALAKVVGLVKSQNLEAAEAALDKIEAAMGNVAAAATAPADAAPTPDPRTAKLADAAAKLRAQVEALPGGDTSDALTKQLDQLDIKIAEGEVEEVVTGLKSIQASLKLQAEVDRVMPAFLEAMSGGKVADPNALSILFNTAVELVPGPDHAKALDALKKAEAMIAQGAAEGASAHSADIAPEVKPFAESRLKWETARGVLNTEMQKLESAILKVCEGNEDLKEVAGNTSALFSYIEALDDRLEDRLDDIVNAAAGPDRDSAKTAARAVLAEYKNTLSEPFFQDVDGNNGFTTVAVASTASATLSEIEAVLAA